MDFRTVTLDSVFWGNSILRYITTTALTIIVIVALQWIRSRLRRRTRDVIGSSPLTILLLRFLQIPLITFVPLVLSLTMAHLDLAPRIENGLRHLTVACSSFRLSTLLPPSRVTQLIECTLGKAKTI